MSFLMQLIMLLPSIIKIVKEIYDLINQLKPNEKDAAKVILQGLTDKVKLGELHISEIVNSFSSYLKELSEKVHKG